MPSSGYKSNAAAKYQSLLVKSPLRRKSNSGANVFFMKLQPITYKFSLFLFFQDKSFKKETQDFLETRKQRSSLFIGPNHLQEK